MSKSFKSLISISVLALFAGTAHAGNLSPEAAIYKDLYPKSNASAERIDEILSPEFIAKINVVEECASKLPGYAGYDTRHEPKFEAVFKFTHRANKKLRKCTRDRDFKARGAAFSVESLQAGLDEVIEAIDGKLTSPGLEVSTKFNRIVLTVKKSEVHKARRALRLAGIHRRLVRIDSVAEIQGGISTNVPGNLKISDGATVCSTSFPMQWEVFNPINFQFETEYGFLSAAHCEDSMTISINSIPLSVPALNPTSDLVRPVLETTLADLQVMALPSSDVAQPTISGASFNLTHDPKVLSAVYVPPINYPACVTGSNSTPTNNLKCGAFLGDQPVDYTTVASIGRYLRLPTLRSTTVVLHAQGDSGGPVYSPNFSSGILAVNPVGTVSGRWTSQDGFGRLVEFKTYYTPISANSQTGARLVTTN